jgi:hypothetical protein
MARKLYLLSVFYLIYILFNQNVSENFGRGSVAPEMLWGVGVRCNSKAEKRCSKERVVVVERCFVQLTVSALRCTPRMHLREVPSVTIIAASFFTV